MTTYIYSAIIGLCLAGTLLAWEGRGTVEQSTPVPAPSWATDVLHGLGNDQPSAATVAYLEAWHRAEGGDATFNWLNTTQGATGATDYNSVGVKNYPDYQSGVDATVATLTNGFYPNTLAGLQANAPTVDDQEMNTWGTGGGAIRAQLAQQPEQAPAADLAARPIVSGADMDAVTQRIYDLDVARWGSGAKLPFNAIYESGDCATHGITDVSDGRRNSEAFGCDAGVTLPIMAHEMGHMICEDYYGHEAESSVDTILAEGTATWIAGDTWRVDYSHVGGVPLTARVENTDEQNTIYEEWASFVDFLIATYGRAAFDKLYSSGHDANGRADYVGVLGKDIPALESDWRAAMAGGGWSSATVASTPISLDGDCGYNVQVALDANGGALQDVRLAPGETFSFNATMGNPGAIDYRMCAGVPGGNWCNLAARYAYVAEQLGLPRQFQDHGVGDLGGGPENSVAIWNEGGQAGGQDLLITNTLTRPVRFQAQLNGGSVTIMGGVE